MVDRGVADRLSSNSAFALELEGVGRQFGALVALVDVTLRVGAGEHRAVLGSNGAGKTTLFNAVTGDFPPTAGRIRFFGEDVTTFPVHERIRRGLRRTYQISQLFAGLTVIDSIFVACCGVSRSRMSLARPTATDATMAQARTIAHSVHLDDLLEKPVSILAHGQQRQLEIALALTGAPRFILLDEPAAGLSPAERRDLVAILQALPAHIGYIIIEHDLDVALQVASYVTIMHNGRVFKEGAPREIEDDDDVQAIYLGAAHG
ncbi:MAG: ABC transporter ATP-binding protein [Hyphomicrobiales bacterium]|nr:ABC transporter ATP-binding protein [Hyphomicrobiales bacterium]